MLTTFRLLWPTMFLNVTPETKYEVLATGMPKSPVTATPPDCHRSRPLEWHAKSCGPPFTRDDPIPEMLCTRRSVKTNDRFPVGKPGKLARYWARTPAPASLSSRPD